MPTSLTGPSQRITRKGPKFAVKVVMPDATPRLRGRAGVAQRKRRLARTHGLCEMCQAEGVTRIADFVDHVLALAHGGSDDDENTQNLCEPHHDAKTREEFNLKPAKKQIALDGWPIEG